MVNRTERGWAGHFICADRCRFRRNTLLEKDGLFVVVSSVGLMEDGEGGFEQIGLERHFETVAFFSKQNDFRYHDADVTRQIYFDSPWRIGIPDADDKANEMHEVVVSELMDKMDKGLLKEVEG